MSRPLPLVLSLGVLIIALVVGGRAFLGGGPGTGTAAQAGPGVPGEPVSVGVSDCGRPWSGGAAGPFDFALRDDGATPVDIYLQRIEDHRIYLDVETLGSGTTRAAQVTIGPGHYRFVCSSTDTGAYAGPAVAVTGTYHGELTPGVDPVTSGDLVKPIVTYQTWVARRLGRLRNAVRALTRSLAAGDLVAARQRWLTAHLIYHTLGAAYDAFGDFGQSIDGLPRSGIPPPRDHHLQGFHKIEALLWRGSPSREILPYAHDLEAAITRLQHHFGQDLVLAPIDIGLRAHEILEDAQRFDLPARADAGSHTDLATVAADIAGTRETLRVLMPILRDRDPHLGRLTSWLDRFERTVRSHHRGGRWTPLSLLTRRQREALDSRLAETLELLSEVAVITDPVQALP